MNPAIPRPSSTTGLSSPVKSVANPTNTAAQTSVSTLLSRSAAASSGRRPPTRSTRSISVDPASALSDDDSVLIAAATIPANRSPRSPAGISSRM